MAFFHNETTKQYIVAFSKLFSNVHVKRYNDTDTEIKDIKVPLIYAAKRKISYMLQKNSNADSASIVLPVMSFNIEGIEFNTERKMNSLNEHSVSSTNSIFEGMPYDYTIEFGIRTKYQEDYWQILEQLLYIFKPEITLDVKELKDFPTFIRDTKVILDSISLENELELTQDEESSREFRANLSFRLQGYLYPADTEDSVIEHVDVNFINSVNEEIINISHDWDGNSITTTITEN